MDRRKFTTVLASATVAWPLALRAQQTGRTRRIGVLTNLAEHDPESKPRVAEIESGLAELGWARDRMRVEYRWAAGDSRLIRTYAAELARDNVDAIVANGLPAAPGLTAETRTIPVVFVHVGDPVALGLVKSISRPEGNMTGFTLWDPAMIAKWSPSSTRTRQLGL